MIEKAIVAGIVIVVALSMLATVLPRIAPSLVALALVAAVLRAVWWYTR